MGLTYINKGIMKRKIIFDKFDKVFINRIKIYYFVLTKIK